MNVKSTIFQLACYTTRQIYFLMCSLFRLIEVLINKMLEEIGESFTEVEQALTHGIVPFIALRLLPRKSKLKP